MIMRIPPRGFFVAARTGFLRVPTSKRTQATWINLEKIPEPLRGQGGIARGILDIAMPGTHLKRCSS